VSAYDLTHSPLLAERVAIAAALTAATGLDAHASYTEAFAVPCFVLTGVGWAPPANGVTKYRVHVTCLYAEQGGASADVVEDICRRASIALADAGLTTYQDVPEPGVVTVGAREYAGMQFTIEDPVELKDI
jgi:hypothetical protein